MIKQSKKKKKEQVRLQAFVTLDILLITNLNNRSSKTQMTILQVSRCAVLCGPATKPYQPESSMKSQPVNGGPEML
jgi:hypothetical protein